MAWQPDEVVHGSTVATNTVLERRGARVAFVATSGFADIIEIGRQARARIYDLEPKRPPPLVPRELRFEVLERLDSRGEVLQELSGADIEHLVKAVCDSRPDAVAVCLLFSFLNPAHEQRIGAALRAAGLDVSLSSEVLPEIREYERASTTVLNAYVGPRMRSYLADLERELSAYGTERLSIVQSSGGTLTATQAGSLPAATLLSGPAAGVAGAFAVARRAGYADVVTFDMGGTSTDVCLCPGRMPYTSEWSIGELPVRLPAVDVHTVGAGGGSLAWLDEGGALRVGPQSAGAEPGPAAYGRGGPATVTDAQLALGRLGESSFLNGAFEVDPKASVSALSGIGLKSVEHAARGIVAVVNTAMARALRLVSVERGFDPAAFTLVAFGGAGPLHACELAEMLRMPRVLVPRYPGVLSAMGTIWADATRDYSTSLTATLGQDDDTAGFAINAQARLEELKSRAQDEMGEAAVLEPAVDLRYAGQGYELTVPWMTDRVTEVLSAFQEEHRRRYGHADAGRAVEVVTLRLRARVPREWDEEQPARVSGADAAAALTSHRRLALESGQTISAAVYDRELLRTGNTFEGPALVSQLDSTTLVPGGWRAIVDTRGNLVIERGG